MIPEGEMDTIDEYSDDGSDMSPRVAYGIIRFPYIVTLIQQIPLLPPAAVVSESSVTAAFTPDQRAVEAIGDIDIERLLVGRTKSAGKFTDKDKNPYSATELKQIAKRIGISTTPNKAGLVAAIRAKILG